MRESLVNILNSKKKTLWLLIGLVAFLTLLYSIICLITKTNYTVGGDAFYQYQFFFCNYIDKIKSGNLSHFNFDNLYGTSIYADAYYVPLNIEFLTILISSFFMNTHLAYSIYQFLKFGLAFIVFYCLLVFTEKKSIKTALLLSCFWVFSGFGCIYILYPTYYNILIYLPLMIILLKSKLEFKNILLTLFSFYITISCFYVAYIIFACACLFLVYDSYINRTKPKIFVKNILITVLHILLGVALASFLVIPSITYIIKYSQFIKEDKQFPFIFQIDKYFYLILSVFKISLKGTLNYGATDYVNHEGLLYFGLFSLLFLVIVFQKEKYKRYRIPIYIELILLFFPIFSMILTGTTLPYSRWYALPLLINLLISSTVIEDEFDRSDIDFSSSNRMLVIVSIVGIVVNLIYITLIFSNILICEDGTKIFCLLSSILSIIFLLSVVIKKGQIITLKRLIFLEAGVIIILFFLSLLSIAGVRETNMQKAEINSLLERNHIRKDDKVYLYLNSKVYNQNSFYSDQTFNNGIYYHSFYNKNIDDFIKINENAGKSGWTKYTSDGNLFLSSFFGYDYFVVENENDTLKNCDYYISIYKDEYYTLYKTKYDLNVFDFIVYENMPTKKDLDDDILSHNIGLFDLSEKDVDYFKYNKNDTKCIGTETINNKNYYKYEFLKQESFDDCNLFLLTVESLSHTGIMEFEDGTRTTYQNNFGYGFKTPKYIYIDEDYNSYNFNLERVDVECFEQVISKQSQYNKKIEINGSSIHVKINSNTPGKGYVCLPITYSDEWKETTNNIEIVKIEDSFIGIEVPNLSNVDITLKYEPSGYNVGIKVEKIFLPFTLLIFSFEVWFQIRKKVYLF